jgi:hypothetical protein
MSDFDQLEALLASGDHVRLRADRPRTCCRSSARGRQERRRRPDRGRSWPVDEVELVPGDAAELLEELRRERAPLGVRQRRAARARAPARTHPEPEPEPEPERPGWLGRLFGR